MMNKPRLNPDEEVERSEGVTRVMPSRVMEDCGGRSRSTMQPPLFAFFLLVGAPLLFVGAMIEISGERRVWFGAWLVSSCSMLCLTTRILAGILPGHHVHTFTSM